MGELLLYGSDLFGDSVKVEPVNTLSKRFEYPPFSVLNAREGYWQERKRAWISQGIQSELGRDESITWKGNVKEFDYYRVKEGTRKPSNRSINTGDWVRSHNEIDGNCGNQSGTSIFDPVLTELMYKWFCPSNGLILDPFAGGSVRGIVAGLLDYKYHGIELSATQVEANQMQKQDIAPDADINWITGDSMQHLPDAPLSDFIFSCPPYGNLEVYSDNPADLSTMQYAKFIEEYSKIIELAVKRLKPNRFACFVIGEFRDKKTGNYQGFVPDTINAFRAAGMNFYNEIILITATGSLPIRVTKQFQAGRKIGKTHQNILLFVKGHPKLGDVS